MLEPILFQNINPTERILVTYGPYAPRVIETL
jgi:hypothetical protein